MKLSSIHLSVVVVSCAVPSFAQTLVRSVNGPVAIAHGTDPSLVAGAELYAQWWSRDPGSPSHTSLSNALRFLLSP